MSRTLPLLALLAIVTLAGCLGGLGFGGGNDNPTTTATPTSTETRQTTASTSATTTSKVTTTTPQTTTPAQTTTRTATATTQATTVPTRTTARVDTPTGSKRFEARVTKIVDPTTINITHGGQTQTVDLIGVRVPDSGLIHKRALQTTKAQLQYGTVTVVTDPKVASDSDSHLQAYVYTDNWLYNTQLLRSGYARVANDEFSKRAEFERKQQEAKQGGYGLWNTTTTPA